MAEVSYIFEAFLARMLTLLSEVTPQRSYPKAYGHAFRLKNPGSDTDLMLRIIFPMGNGTSQV